MAGKKQAKEQTLEDKLWDTAELLRGKVSPTSYKDIALGLLFLKFISNRYDVGRADIEVARKVYAKYGSHEGNLDGLSHSMSRWLGWNTERCLEALQKVRESQ